MKQHPLHTFLEYLKNLDKRYKYCLRFAALVVVLASVCTAIMFGGGILLFRAATAGSNLATGLIAIIVVLLLVLLFESFIKLTGCDSDEYSFKSSRHDDTTTPDYPQ